MTTPDLDSRASPNFTFADLCHCSETWQALRIDNRPKALETFEAIARLCAEILEPAQAEFGPLTLTYGFAGPALTRHIHRRIAPRLDQHAGMERNRAGGLICPRGGQAADFHVAGVRASRLALFLAESTPFDRLYVYGDDRPVHVSLGPENARQIVALRSHGGRLLPRALSLSALRDSAR